MDSSFGVVWAFSLVLTGLTGIGVEPVGVNGGNVLALMPLPLRSHTKTYTPLYIELARRGHNVTFYTNFPFAEEVPNLKVVHVDFNIDEYIDEKRETIRELVGWTHVLFTWDFGTYMCNEILKNEQVKGLFNSTDKYDVVILETLFVHEALIAVGHKFGAPVINVHPFRIDGWLSSLLRNPYPMSYLADFRLSLSESMTFFDRLNNVLLLMFQMVSGFLYYLPKQEEIMRNGIWYEGSESMPSILEMLRNTSLTLVDGNPAVGFPTPHLPNVISVGGLHITPDDQNNLPTDLERWMNESSDGVIYFSMGTVVKVSSLEPEVIRTLVNTFAKLPQRVLFKWDLDTDLPGKPSNVRTSKWFPQQAVLAHPKCRLFVTHGGFHSIVEAAYYGVPLIGTPVFVDQHGNLLAVQERGFGELFNLQQINQHQLTVLVNKVINDPSYRENALKVSRIIKDVPMSPLETAAFWIEYVIRNRGALALKSPNIYMPWYKFYLIDVSLFCIASLILLAILVYSTGYWIVRILQKIFIIIKWKSDNKTKTILTKDKKIK